MFYTKDTRFFFSSSSFFIQSPQLLDVYGFVLFISFLFFLLALIRMNNSWLAICDDDKSQTREHFMCCAHVFVWFVYYFFRLVVVWFGFQLGLVIRSSSKIRCEFHGTYATWCVIFGWGNLNQCIRMAIHREPEQQTDVCTVRFTAECLAYFVSGNHFRLIRIKTNNSNTMPFISAAVFKFAGFWLLCAF